MNAVQAECGLKDPLPEKDREVDVYVAGPVGKVHVGLILAPRAWLNMVSNSLYVPRGFLIGLAD